MQPGAYPTPDSAKQRYEQILLLHHELLQLPQGSTTGHKLVSQAGIVARMHPLCLHHSSNDARNKPVWRRLTCVACT